MFGHTSAPSRIFRFQARLPTAGLEVIEEQLTLAHRYRNALVALERRRRAMVHHALVQAMPTGVAWEATVAMLEAMLESHRDVLARQHAKKRRREISAEAKAIAAILKQALREARGHHRALRRLAAGKGLDADDHTHQMLHHCQLTAQDASEALHQVDEAIHAERKRLRANCGLYWGNYLAVEQGMQAARSGPPPRFRRYDRQGKLAVQIQHGMSPEELHSLQDPRLQLEAPKVDDLGRIYRRHRRVLCRFRIGSVGREPLWAELPVIMTRPLPYDSRVKWAYLKRERVATHLYWYLELVLSRDKGWPKPDAAQTGIVGIDPGYRRRPHGLRVMYWLGDDHQGSELVLPEEWLQKWSWVFELAALRKRRMNAIVADLVRWVKDHGRPAWWPEDTRTLARWCSPAQLAALTLQWRREHADEAPDMLARLEAWRKMDKRQYEEQEHLRRHLIDARDDLYRKTALALRRRYQTAVIEDTDWEALARREEAEEVRRLPAIVGRYRQIAAPSRLTQILREAFAEVLDAPSGYSTQRCSICGRLMGITRRDGTYVPPDNASLEIRCPWDHTLHDQDANAARNFRDAGPALRKRAAR